MYIGNMISIIIDGKIGNSDADWICGYTPKNKDKAIYNNTLKCNCVLAIRIHDCSFD